MEKSAPRKSRRCWDSTVVWLSGMYRWPPSTSGSLTSCALRERCCNERGPAGQNGVAGEPERTAPASDACLFRAGGATGGERNSELRAILAGVGRSEEHTSELQSLRHLVCR